MKRRTWLRQWGGLAGAAPLACLARALPLAGMAGAACAPPPGDSGILDLELADIPEGRHMATRIALHPVDVRRRGREVVATSLLCTHFGCRVRWHPAEESYICPCHDGRFDEMGQPTGGPPVVPLDRLPVVIDGTRVRIGPPPGRDEPA